MTSRPRTAPRKSTSASDGAAQIDAARRSPDAALRLVELLPERAPLYAGRGSNEAERLRSYVLASFESIGLPPNAVPYVLEELETGRNPYTVAAAARALRGAAVMPPAAPALLVAAIRRLRAVDDVVTFERFAPTLDSTDSVTALSELASTLAWIGPRASHVLEPLTSLVENEGHRFSDAVLAALTKAVAALGQSEAATVGCCGTNDDEVAATTESGFVAASAVDPRHVLLENQDGQRLVFAEAFGGRPSALAFFYTRCTNPEKCSLTVTKVARLARRIRSDGLEANVAGISYDPRFDHPARLRRYGVDRGMRFSPRCSLLRTVGLLDPLVDAFELGVGYGPVTVNRHRLDLIVLDASLGVTQRFERRLWTESAALDALRMQATATA
ncbi:MAG: SCO family protein [Gaiellaceae bacterium]